MGTRAQRRPRPGLTDKPKNGNTAGEKSHRPTIWSACGVLVRGRNQLAGENGLEASLLVLVVQHHHRYDAQRVAACSTGRQLALQVLQEPVGEMVLRASAPGRLGAPLTAMRTGELHHVILRVAIKGGPTGVTHAHSFNGLSVHRMPASPHYDVSATISDAAGRFADATHG